MITTRIQIDRQTDMPSEKECFPGFLGQTTVTDHYSPTTNHYSLARMNSFKTIQDRYRQMFISHYYSLACVKRDLTYS